MVTHTAIVVIFVAMTVHRTTSVAPSSPWSSVAMVRVDAWVVLDASETMLKHDSVKKTVTLIEHMVLVYTTICLGACPENGECVPVPLCLCRQPPRPDATMVTFLMLAHELRLTAT